MFVHEHAAPVSIRMLTNRPPRLALILIRLPLVIMLPIATEDTKRLARSACKFLYGLTEF